MINALTERLFLLSERKTTVRREILAGLTSFMAMCYLIFVIPGMLADAGMPRDSAVAATIWITIIATLIMGLWARFPVAVAPGLGITAFFAYYICGPAGYDWETGLGAVFVSGVVFLVLTVTRVRQMIIDAVPMDLKYAIVVGIGAFIAFIGMKNCGIVTANASTFVTLGDLATPQTLLAIGGVFLTAALIALHVPGGMVISIVAISCVGMALGFSPMPEGAFFTPRPPMPVEIFGRLDIMGALGHGLVSIIFTLTMVDLFDNMGVLIGLSQKAGFIRKDGHIDNLDRALVTDSIATMASAVVGATTATSYLECAAGVAEGGRTGLTAVTIAALFFLTLFFAPLVALVPSYATAPTLIIVGAMMMQEVLRIRFQHFTVALPAFLTIVGMPLTFNIATGFGFGFISWVGIRALTGRFRELNPVLVAIAICFAINFALRAHG
ncbi:MAG: NCS2 family permease [Desulfovibrio sp.]|nr:NCS2 family permease [Desulfovibrio sp.]